MGLQGKAALVGVAQYKPQKYATAPRMFHLEQVADLTLQALEDAGMELSEVDGLITSAPHFHEASCFVPAMAGEYLGVRLNFAEVVDLGGPVPWPWSGVRRLRSSWGCATPWSACCPRAWHRSQNMTTTSRKS